MAKILIIDDDKRNIFALTAVLKSRAYETVSAIKMEEAMKILKDDSSIGIILMDMMMPGMDGYEAIPLIKNDPAFPRIPIVAVTAQAMTGDREKCIAAGADGYISKPVDIGELETVLKKYIHD